MGQFGFTAEASKDTLDKAFGFFNNGGTSVEQTPQRYRVVTSDLDATLTGQSFSYNNGRLVDGSITGLTLNSSAGSRILDASGLSVSASSLQNVQTSAEALNAFFSGFDIVNGNPFAPNNDILPGRGGDDTLRGYAGNDIIYGNIGSDLIYGNMGDDKFYGGLHNDKLYGGQGADIVYGNFGADIVYGNLGTDILFGGQGNDVLYGGRDNDTLFGNLGDDTLVGGLGADRYSFGQNSGRDLILGFSRGDGDRLDFGGQSYTFADNGHGGTVFTLSGGGTVEIAGVPPDQVNSGFFA